MNPIGHSHSPSWPQVPGEHEEAVQAPRRERGSRWTIRLEERLVDALAFEGGRVADAVAAAFEGFCVFEETRTGLIAGVAVVPGGTDASVVAASSVSVAHDNGAILHTRSGALRFARFTRKERAGADAVVGAIGFFADSISITLHHLILHEQPGTTDVAFLPMIATHHMSPSRKPVVAFALSTHYLTVDAFR